MISTLRSCLLFVIRLNKLLKGEASEWLHSIRGVVHSTQITLETSARCSLCHEMSMKMLMAPNADRWSFSTVSVSVRREEKCQLRIRFILKVVYLAVTVHRCIDLLFYDMLHKNKSQWCPSCLYCMFTVPLFHPQQVCLQAPVNHDGGLLAAPLGSC